MSINPNTFAPHATSSKDGVQPWSVGPKFLAAIEPWVFYITMVLAFVAVTTDIFFWRP